MSALRLRLRGQLAALGAAERALLLDRSFSTDPAVGADVAAIVADVRRGGDAVLRGLAARFDGAQLERLEVDRRELRRAQESLAPELRAALERAADNLQRVARAELPRPSELEVEPGLVVGRRADPLASVGVYAPGGKAAYPSSVLMGVVPARAAGVGEILVVSPPQPSGLPSDVVLAAAAIGGADRVFALGGAGAIAALAYGTETIPAVDLIVGPGNAWVAEAKRQVSIDVRIDSPAGPSELLLIADDAADPEQLVRELLAQAEHDEAACVVALLLDERLAVEVERLLLTRAKDAVRASTIAAALATRGAVLTASSIDEALAFSSAFAPEHLMLALRDAERVVPRVRNAGTIFVGSASSVAFGDYATGANHVLPTAGAARRCSGLSVFDFIRWQTWQRVTPEAAARLADDVTLLATSEALPQHAAAAAAWRSGSSLPSRSSGAAPLRGRPRLAAVQRYVPLRPPCRVDLSDNTNRFGLPPAIRALLASAEEDRLTRYPTPYADALLAALAGLCGVQSANVVTGCGSDDVLDATFRAVTEPGDRLAYCPPTFSMIPPLAQVAGLVAVPCALSIDALAKASARVIYLCSPNNPTGAVLPAGFLEALLETTRAIVVLDEAYIDYAERPSLGALAARCDRLIVVRTLSKAFGLAGLRVGWAVATPSMVAEIEKCRGPYKVGNLAERVAVAMVTEQRAWVDAQIAETIALRERFVAALAELGLAALPSVANFVLVKTPISAETLVARLHATSVSVRGFPGLPEIGDAVRISIAPWPQLLACLAALESALAVRS